MCLWHASSKAVPGGIDTPGSYSIPYLDGVCKDCEQYLLVNFKALVSAATLEWGMSPTATPVTRKTLNGPWWAPSSNNQAVPISLDGSRVSCWLLKVLQNMQLHGTCCWGLPVGLFSLTYNWSIVIIVNNSLKGLPQYITFVFYKQPSWAVGKREPVFTVTSGFKQINFISCTWRT